MHLVVVPPISILCASPSGGTAAPRWWTGRAGTCCRTAWKKIGTPTLQKDETRPLISASNDVIPTSGSVDLDVTVTTEDGDANSQILPFTVTDQLDILGTNAINSLQLTIRNNPVKVHVDNIRTIRSHQHLQESCLQICKEFPDLWKPELGCLKDYSLEVKFKPDVTLDSASHAQYHSLYKKTSTKPMMSESRREFGSL